MTSSGSRRILYHKACNDARARDPFDDDLRDSYLAIIAPLRAGVDIPTESIPGASPDVLLTPLLNGRSLVWQRFDGGAVLLWIDLRSAAVRWAQRFHLVRQDDEPTVFEVDSSFRPIRSYEEARSVSGALFMAWSDDDLAVMGFEVASIPWLRECTTRPDLDELKPALGTIDFDRARDLATRGTVGDLLSLKTTVATPPSQHLDEQLSLVTLGSSLVDVSKLEEALLRPVEDWMIFLHSSQRDFMRANFNGPSRISGPAGSGKTVIAIHKAVEQAFAGSVLVTTMVRTLPPVFEQLAVRLSPTAADRVEFSGLHKWASTYLRRNEIPFTLDGDGARTACNRAWNRARQRGDRIAQRVTPDYARDEIDWIIKPRQLDLDGYLDTDRHGRSVGFDRSLRQEMWNLFRDYEQLLAERQIIDFNDLFSLALQHVSSSGRPPFDMVIIDEAQDVNELGLRLAHAICRPPGRLLLVADERQSLYPARVVLSRVGINVVGRSRKLRLNFRNTRQIFDVARAMLAEQRIVDLDEGRPAEPYEVDLVRTGPWPTMGQSDDDDAHLVALAEAVDVACARPSVRPGDIAVLVADTRQAAAVARSLRAAGHETLTLTEYRAAGEGHRVLVGTYKRAKGLEFKHVFLPFLDATSFHDVRSEHENEEEHDERRSERARELFVAATRARDRLWLGWAGTPTGLISDAIELVRAETAT